MGHDRSISTSIIVISDEGIPRQALVHLLQAQAQYKVLGESTVDAAKSLEWDGVPGVAVIHAGSAGAGVLGLIPCLKSAEIPVVVLFRHRNPWLVQAFLKAGASGLVLMEAKPAELFRAIDAAAARKPFLDPLLSQVVFEFVPEPTRDVTRELSRREAQVLKHLAYGFTNAQIARRLSVSVKSVEIYRARMMEKLQLKDRTDLVRFALVTGILDANAIDGDLAS